MGDAFYIAGPCSAESEEQMMETALGLKGSGVTAFRAGIWKARTRPGTFEGAGNKGLSWLKRAGNAAGIGVITEVATPGHVEACLKEGIDMLWIGARTTSNPFAVQAVADALKGVDIPLWVKNPLNPDIELWLGALERFHKVGISRMGAIHRGFSIHSKTNFRNPPIWRIPIELMRRLPGIPMLCDPSHICGNRDLLFSVAQNAMNLLFDGLMLEVHYNPDEALSDAKQQVTPERYLSMVSRLKKKEAAAFSPEDRAPVGFLRKDIDRVDNAILELLAERMDYVKGIALLKRKDNVSLFQPDRWREVVKTRTRDGAARNLSEEFVLKLFQLIHEEALRLQEEILSE